MGFSPLLPHSSTIKRPPFTLASGMALDRDVIAAMAVAERHEVISYDASLEKKAVTAHESIDDSDGAHAGLEFPSEEELVTLRRISDDIPWTAFCWFFRTSS